MSMACFGQHTKAAKRSESDCFDAEMPWHSGALQGLSDHQPAAAQAQPQQESNSAVPPQAVSDSAAIPKASLHWVDICVPDLLSSPCCELMREGNFLKAM